MQSDTMTLQVPRAAQQAAVEVSAPTLDYAQPRRFARLRRWLRPGSPVFFLLVLALAAGGTWGVWKLWLRMDERAFNERATIDSGGQIVFSKPPTAASLRHLARLPGTLVVGFRWSGEADSSAIAAFRGHRLHNVASIWIRGGLNADALLKELARPGTGLTALTDLDLTQSQVTDAGLKELARPDSDLKALTNLGLYNTPVTDAGLKELARPGSGLKAFTYLDLRAYDHLGQPAIQNKVTDDCVEALKKARPGLTVAH